MFNVMKNVKTAALDPIYLAPHIVENSLLIIVHYQYVPRGLQVAIFDWSIT